MHFYVWSILWNEDDCRDCVGEWGKGHWAEGSLLSIRCFSHCYVLFMCNDKNLNIKPIICINAIIESMKRTKTTKQINSRKYWCKDFSQKPWLLLTAVHVSSPAQEEPLLKPPSCAPPPPASPRSVFMSECQVPQQGPQAGCPWTDWTDPRPGEQQSWGSNWWWLPKSLRLLLQTFAYVPRWAKDRSGGSMGGSFFNKNETI